jgi:hypothetical protein
MKRASVFSAALGLMVLSILPAPADITVHERLKLRHVCGIVVDSAGEPIPNAKLRMLRGDVEVEAAETPGDGKVDFGRLEAGDYRLKVGAQNFKSDEVPIVIASPRRHASRGFGFS